MLGTGENAKRSRDGKYNGEECEGYKNATQYAESKTKQIETNEKRKESKTSLSGITSLEKSEPTGKSGGHKSEYWKTVCPSSIRGRERRAN